jgi:hypothetical protein
MIEGVIAISHAGARRRLIDTLAKDIIKIPARRGWRNHIFWQTPGAEAVAWGNFVNE